MLLPGRTLNTSGEKCAIGTASAISVGVVVKTPTVPVKFSIAGFDSKPEKIREVLFIDTEDFRLYNNAFISGARAASTSR